MSQPISSTSTFASLIETIRQVHQNLAAQAGRAVNISLTLRNWLIGYHIEEYERNGKDRADYGDRLMDSLAEKLSSEGVSRCDRRELYRYRQFYLTYPQIVESLTPQFKKMMEQQAQEVAPATKHSIVEPLTPQFMLDSSTLLAKLSFTHIVELIAIDDATKRSFYEIESIRGNWSVRELKRQIGSLYVSVRETASLHAS